MLWYIPALSLSLKEFLVQNDGLVFFFSSIPLVYLWISSVLFLTRKSFSEAERFSVEPLQVRSPLIGIPRSFPFSPPVPPKPASSYFRPRSLCGRQIPSNKFVGLRSEKIFPFLPSASNRAGPIPLSQTPPLFFRLFSHHTLRNLEP